MAKLGSIRKQFFISVGLTALAVLAAFFGYHQVVSRCIRKNAQENLSFIINGLSRELGDYFSDLGKAGLALASDAAAQSFLREMYFKRYSQGAEMQQLYSNVATQSAYASGCILFDLNGNFYRYGSFSLTNQQCLALFEEFQQNEPAESCRSILVEGERYFCQMTPVYDFYGSPAVRLGTVFFLSRGEKVRQLFAEYDSFGSLKLVLESGGEILVANDSDLEGAALAENPLFDSGRSFTQNRQLHPRQYSLLAAMEKRAVFPYETMLAGSVAVLLVLIVLLFLTFTIKTARMFVEPVSRIINEMKGIGEASLHGRLSPVRNPALNQLVGNINALMDRAESYSRRVFQTQQKLYEVELKRKEMDLYMLRKQISTHFVFNSLNSIRSLAHQSGQEDIAAIAQGLAQLFRYAYTPEPTINIFDEMRLIDQYVEIMNIRFHGKFQVEYEVDDLLCGYRIYRQMIQPLVENALLHGLEGKEKDCKLRITGVFMGDHLTIRVDDNGAGIPEPQLLRIREKLESEEDNPAPSGIAMVNIHRRLRLLCGPRFGLTLDSREGEGTTVQFNFPLLQDPDAGGDEDALR